jgi:hypothetical protein
VVLAQLLLSLAFRVSEHLRYFNSFVAFVLIAQNKNVVTIIDSNRTVEELCDFAQRCIEICTQTTNNTKRRLSIAYSWQKCAQGTGDDDSTA